MASGYYTNRYGRQVPYEVLMWASVGTSVRHKGKRNKIIQHYNNGSGSRITGRRYSRSGSSTGWIQGSRAMEAAKQTTSSQVTSELQSSLLEATNKVALKHGCTVN